MHTLKLYDQPLLDFDMKRYGDSFKVSTCRLYENALPYLPLDWNLAKINDPKKVEQSDQLAVFLNLLIRTIPGIKRAIIHNCCTRPNAADPAAQTHSISSSKRAWLTLEYAYR